MKTKIIADKDSNEVARQLKITLEHCTDFTIHYSTCPLGTYGVIMYSVLVTWV